MICFSFNLQILVDMLESGTHLPAILQSLGCITQNAMPVFETREEDVIQFLRDKLFHRTTYALNTHYYYYYYFGLSSLWFSINLLWYLHSDSVREISCFKNIADFLKTEWEDMCKECLLKVSMHMWCYNLYLFGLFP